MGGARLDSALLVVRRGSELLYIHDRELAREFLFAQSALQRVDSAVAQPPVQPATQELIRFEGEFVEIVNTSMRRDCASLGSALAAIKPHIEPMLANTIRNLIRARGASVHLVPHGRCQRVLGEIQDSLRHLSADYADGKTLRDPTSVSPRSTGGSAGSGRSEVTVEPSLASESIAAVPGTLGVSDDSDDVANVIAGEDFERAANSRRMKNTNKHRTDGRASLTQTMGVCKTSGGTEADSTPMSSHRPANDSKKNRVNKDEQPFTKEVKASDTVVEPYNAVLSSHQLADRAEGVPRENLDYESALKEAEADWLRRKADRGRESR